MSKTSSKNTGKMDNRGDHKRDSSGGRNEKSHSRSDSNSKNSVKHEEKETEPTLGAEANAKDKDTEAKTAEEKKFTGRCRLFVGNLTPDVTEEDFKKMFEPYGEISEVYVNTGRGFGFIRLDYRQNAEAAKAALDGLQRKGRILRVRFATHGAALRVKNLHPYVSNELLERAFSQFGELERAIVIVDDRGKPTGEGLIEFVRKPGAQQALRRINEGVFLLGVDPKPIEVEPLEQKDEEDGMPEKFLPRNEQYKKEREKDPRFAPPGSFEYEFGMRWKQLDEMERKRIEQLKKDTEEARIKLEDEMQNALYEYQAEQIRQDLLRQQEELRRLEELRNKDRMRRQQELEMRRQEEERQRQADERRRQEMMLRQQEMAGRRGVPPGGMESGMRGGPAGPLESGLRSREDMMGGLRGEGGFPAGPGMRGSGSGGADPVGIRGGRGAPPLQPPPAPPAGMGLERGGPLGQSSMGRMQGGGGPGVSAPAGFGGQAGNVGQAGHPGMGGASPSSGGPGMGGSPNISNMGGPSGPSQQMDLDFISCVDAHRWPDLYPEDEESCEGLGGISLPSDHRVADGASALGHNWTEGSRQDVSDLTFCAGGHEQVSRDKTCQEPLEMLGGVHGTDREEEAILEQVDMVSDLDAAAQSWQDQVSQDGEHAVLHSSGDSRGQELASTVSIYGAKAQMQGNTIGLEKENVTSNSRLSGHHQRMTLHCQPSVVRPIIPLTVPFPKVATSVPQQMLSSTSRGVSAAHLAMLRQRQQQAMMAHMIRQRYMGPVLVPGRFVAVSGPGVRVRVRWSRWTMSEGM